MFNKKIKFKIENGHLIIGDDEIYLHWVNNICVRESAMREGEYAIHVESEGHIFNIIELYYTGDADEVYDAYQELCDAIKKQCPEFYSCFRTELINMRNVQEVSHNGGFLLNSKIKIEFKRGEPLIRRGSKPECKQIKEAVVDYKESRKRINDLV